MTATVRKFEPMPAKISEVPLLIGLIGPPGGGKTLSALRLAKGMQAARPGPIVVIETEHGRATKYATDVPFEWINFQPPFVPEDFLTAVKRALAQNPAAIIIDSMSDEHEGQGGVLDWHDAEIPKMGGNEWAAWSKPKASRRRMINGFLQIKVPIIMTFRAREKTRLQKDHRGKDVPVNIGYQPIAPSEVIYALDVTCILPPRANGVPVWKSEKIGEDFIIKLPKFLAPCFARDCALDEQTGEALRRWSLGSPEASPQPEKAPAAASPQTQAKSAAGEPLTKERLDAAHDTLRAAATNGMAALEKEWLALDNDVRRKLKGDLKSLKEAAAAADRMKNAPTLPME